MATADALSDAEAIAQIRAGQVEMYRVLVDRHQQAVYNAAYRLLGHKDEAADVSQDAFLRAYRALARFDASRPFAPWVCRIAINLALTRLKRQQQTYSLDDDIATEGIRLVDPQPGPAAQLLAAERARQVREAILKLPPEQRVIIELRHFQDQSYEAIAATLNISLANAKSRLFRARRRLRDLLRPGGD